MEFLVFQLCKYIALIIVYYTYIQLNATIASPVNNRLAYSEFKFKSQPIFYTINAIFNAYTENCHKFFLSLLENVQSYTKEMCVIYLGT